MENEVKPKAYYVKATLLFGAVCIMLAVAAFFAGRAAVAKGNKTAGWVKTNAQITAFDYMATVESDQILVTFFDREGAEHTVPLGYFSADLYMGQSVAIVYDPAEPNHIVYVGNDSFFAKYGGTVMLSVAALLSAVVAVALRKKAKAAQN